MLLFSDLVRDLRKGRGLSLGRLALASGVNKATLSRWEAGTHLPCLPELTRTLDALGASPSERARCLQTLDAPRAVLAVRRDPNGAAYLSLGDMLAGLRSRSGKTQADVARAAGVSRSLYAQWEQDSVQPSADQLHAAAWAMGASAGEAAELLGHFGRVPLENNREAVLRQYQTLFVTATTSMDTQEWYNLQFLTLLAHSTRLLRSEKGSTGDVGLILSAFGNSAMDWQGDIESRGVYHRRALALAERSNEPLHFHLVSAVHSLLDVRTNPCPRWERIAAARGWLPHFRTNAGKSYLLMFIAKEMAKEEPSEALRLADEYCALVAGDASEYPCRLQDRGKLLLECGRAAEGVAFIAATPAQDTYREGLKQLSLAKGLVALGSVAQARACLDAGKAILAPMSNEYVRTQIVALEAALA